MTELLIDGRTMTAIPGLLELQLVYNTGRPSACFASVAALALLSLAVSIGLLIWLATASPAPLAGTGPGLSARRNHRQRHRPLAPGRR